MSILARFKVFERKEATKKDPNPVYSLEAVDDGTDGDGRHFAWGNPLGRIKLRVSNPKAQKELDYGLASGEEYFVEITRTTK